MLHKLSGLELMLALLVTMLGGWLGALIVIFYSLARSAGTNCWQEKDVPYRFRLAM